MYKHFLVISLFGLLLSCTQEGADSQATAESGGSEIKDIIRMPVSAKDPVDSTNVAKFKFEEETYNFGTTREGNSVEHDYKFTNVGKVPLVIKDARSSCGCTVPEWPKDPIPPGAEGVISVKFNTAGKTENQTKPITITANTYPSKTVLRIEGYVIKQQFK